MCELRTMPQGHPDYRFIGQEMWRKIEKVHPALAASGGFVDWQKYRLGRVQSEMRTEFKKSAIERQTGVDSYPQTATERVLVRGSPVAGRKGEP